MSEWAENGSKNYTINGMKLVVFATAPVAPLANALPSPDNSLTPVAIPTDCGYNWRSIVNPLLQTDVRRHSELSSASLFAACYAASFSPRRASSAPAPASFVIATVSTCLLLSSASPPIRWLRPGFRSRDHRSRRFRNGRSGCAHRQLLPVQHRFRCLRRN